MEVVAAAPLIETTGNTNGRHATPDVAVGNPFLGGGGPRNIQLSAKLTF